MARCLLVVWLVVAPALGGCAAGREEGRTRVHAVPAEARAADPVYLSNSFWVWLEEHKGAKYTAYTALGTACVARTLALALFTAFMIWPPVPLA